ncbi:MAG: J domain-containing protein [Actinomycetota bacterium]|nr:J domain-containing protein [Actinomycetota bacterium]
MARLDPYQTLGVSPTASDAEVRAAYRRLVQLHHPDHNGGSAESTRRFEEIQEAYAQVRQRHGGATGTRRESTTRAQPPPQRPSPPPPPRRASADPPPDPRISDMEREIREAHLARERARQAAREAAAASAKRPSDEELGYIKTDDSLGRILADARAQASERFAEVKEPVTKRVADLLDELASKLNGDGPPRPRE